MSRDLTDVLHAFVDDQARASAAQGPDLAQRARTVAALTRRRRTQRVGGLAAASVALLAAGAVAASALTGPEPQPAVPEPSATASASPSPSATPTPTASATPAGPGTPVTASGARGVVDSLATQPTALWSVSAADLVPDFPGEDPPLFSNVVHGNIRAGTAVVDAGRTVVVLVADYLGLEQRLVGLDAATGEARWVRTWDDARPTHRCVGTSPDGLVVCSGTTGPPDGGNHELQLLDPASGEIVRAYPIGDGADSLGIAGSVAVLHAGEGPEGIDVSWSGIDVLTGEVLFSHDEPGRGEAFEVTGDPLSDTGVSGPYARLAGYFYDVTIDVRTGAEVPVPVGAALNDDLAVWAPTDPETVPVFSSLIHENGVVRYGDQAPLHALDPRDGSTLWEQDAVGWYPAAVVGDVLLARDDDSTAALDARTGRPLWTAPVSGAVVATDGTRILLDGGTVLRLADGEVLTTGLSARSLGSASVRGATGRLAGIGNDAMSLTLFGW